MASIAAGFSYLLITGSSDEAASEQAADITVGRTVRLADRIGAHPAGRGRRPDRVGQRSGLLGVGVRRATHACSRRVSREALHARRGAGPADGDCGGLRGSRDRRAAAGRRSPWSRRRSSATAASRARCSPGRSARRRSSAGIDALRGDRFTAAAIAVAVAIVIGFLIATAITTRVKRLAGSAARITEGRLDEPLAGDRRAGRDHRARHGAGDDADRAARDLRGAVVGARPAVGDLRRPRRRASWWSASRRGAVLEPAAEPLIGPDGKAIDGARALAAARRRARRRRARRPAGRRPRLRGRDPRAAGRGRGAGGGARSHRRASPRARRARVRLQCGPRAAQPDRRHLGRDRGPARRRQGRSRTRATTSSPGSRRTSSGSPASPTRC